MNVISFNLSNELLSAVDAVAAARRVPRSVCIREALERLVTSAQPAEPVVGEAPKRAPVSKPKGDKMRLFVCREFNCKLSTHACAQRHILAQPSQRVTHGSPLGQVSQQTARQCTYCPVGQAHASGIEASKWNDSTPVEYLTAAIATPVATQKKMPSPGLPIKRATRVE